MTSSIARILALDVRARRFGFAMFEGPDELLDWGVKSFRHGVNAVKVPASQKITGLLSEFRPHVVVVDKSPLRENFWLMGTILRVARKQNIPTQTVSRAAVQKRFAGQAQDKHGIAIVLSGRFPELAEYYYRNVVGRALAAMRALLRRAHERGELADDTLVRFPQLIVAPGMVAIIWSGLFDRFEPLDVAAMMRAHIAVLFEGCAP